MESPNRACGPVDLFAATTAATIAEHNEDPPVPDGVYRAAIEGLRFTERPSSVVPVMVWTFRIRAGAHSDQILQKRRLLAASSLHAVREELTRCGIPLRRFSDLFERSGQLIGRGVRIAKHTTNGVVHVRVLCCDDPPDRS
jgi:hypothetical protein